ncbi:hypothetical protein QH494_22625 [Sphingomonas sp. AR_OL41]|uniref:hypothetical protein n=1 Tax=Sphingomonas sp. AR_OL41 TaxID=3042729 RepID=UPI002480F1EA|nr:hypothetical protein [Sphingomonas sp. AR_OL41]MDH7974990.1 hypothetical protein [Sphingomonas sp. AR_OL41]
MTSIFTKTALTLALGASALTVAAPAEAQRYGGHRGHDGGGTAIIAGIAGLAIGAAIIASTSHRRDDRDAARYNGSDGYYDDVDGERGGYYRDERSDRDGQYRRDGGYRGDGYGDAYGRGDDRRDGRCHVETRWDRDAGERVMVRICR